MLFHWPMIRRKPLAFPTLLFASAKRSLLGRLDTGSSVPWIAAMQPCAFIPLVFRYSFALQAICTPFLRSHSVDHVALSCARE